MLLLLINGIVPLRLYRYLFKEICSNFFAVALVLMLIFVSGRFVKYLAEVAAGSISSKVLFSIVFFRMPGFMELIFPLALFMGVMLAFGRLYVESEMIVMQACGMSKRRLLLYTQGPALLVMILVSFFTLYLTPLGWKKFHDIWNDPATYSGLGTMVAGSFKKFESQNLVVYTAQMNTQKTQLQDVFAVKSSADANNHELMVIKAKTAEVVTIETGEPFVQLYGGHQYSGVPGKLDFTASKFSTYGQRLREPDNGKARTNSVDGIPTAELWGATDTKEKAALGWRLAMPFIVPIVALIALALSETNHRKGRYGKLLPGFLLYTVYLALLIGVRSQLEKGKLSGIEAYGVVHLIFLCVGLVLFYFSQLKIRFSRQKSVAS